MNFIDFHLLRLKMPGPKSSCKTSQDEATGLLELLRSGCFFLNTTEGQISPPSLKVCTHTGLHFVMPHCHKKAGLVRQYLEDGSFGSSPAPAPHKHVHQFKEGLHVTKGNQNKGLAEKNGLPEQTDFVCILRGDVKYLEKIREHIEKVYANKGLVITTKSAVSSEEIHLLTDTEWEEYQKLKKRDDRLIGAGFP